MKAASTAPRRPTDWFRRVGYALRACWQDPTLYPPAPYDSFDVELCAKTFMRNQELIHTCAARLGATALTYLQPANGLGKRPVLLADTAALAHVRRRRTVDGMNQVQALEAFYELVRSHVSKRQDNGFHDLTGIFDLEPRAIYFDHAHPSDLGYEILADRIAADIMLAEQVVSSGGRAV